MSSIFTTALLGSAVVAGSVLGFTLAQDSSVMIKSCIGQKCPAPGAQSGEGSKGSPNDPPQGTSQGNVRPAPREASQIKVRTEQELKVETKIEDSALALAPNPPSYSGWQFNPDRHQRRRSKSATFRFYLNGYWYPEPYWRVRELKPNRLSCGQGRAIVSEWFRRVRVIECSGPYYTYLGGRNEDVYRIRLNARTGRIVGRAPLQEF